MVLGHEPVLHQHGRPHAGLQLPGDLDGDRVEVALDGVTPGFEQVSDVHQQLVDHGAQPPGG